MRPKAPAIKTEGKIANPSKPGENHIKTQGDVISRFYPYNRSLIVVCTHGNQAEDHPAIEQYA